MYTKNLIVTTSGLNGESSASLAIKGMQIKTSKKYYFAATRITIQ